MRGWWGGGGRGVSSFSVKNFLSHSVEKFRRGTGNPSLFHDISGIEKNYG